MTKPFRHRRGDYLTCHEKERKKEREREIGKEEIGKEKDIEMH